MNLSFITAENWAELNRRFPQADAFLLECSLDGELSYLHSQQAQSWFTPWQRKRLTELEKWGELA